MSGAESRERDLSSAITRVREGLRGRGHTVVVAESCTGGWLARDLTADPGASDVFWGGVVVYADSAKEALAGVSPARIADHGAVSEAVARDLATGTLARSDADWGVAITGVAGPDGGSPEKPVGTVWVAVAGPGGVSARMHRWAGSREEIRRAAVEGALLQLAERLERAE